MKIAYFRKSTRSYDETLEALQAKALEQGWKALGTTPLPDDQGSLVLLCRPDWLAQVLKTDHQILGFVPCSVSVLKKDNQVLVGVSQLMQLLAQTPLMAEMADQAMGQLKELVHTAAGVAEPKLEKVKLYSTKSCPYCKMEKSWLEGQKIAFEEVYVDLNREEAERLMLQTGQMGVPVTEFVYDEAEPEYVIGFDRDRLKGLLKLEQPITV
ncbi:MAG: glutaredoxin domain-containing protein [Candidatus Sericytochromatia bacterium]